MTTTGDGDRIPWRGETATFVGGLVVFTLFGLGTLTAGAGAVVAGSSPGLHEGLHLTALEPTMAGRLAQGIADTSHDLQPPAGLAIDYLFSLFNLALAGLLLWLRPRDWSARFLVVALIGTASIFNLQAYGVYERLDATTLETSGHIAFHASTGIAYLLALLSFPDGHLVPRWRPAPLTALYASGLIAIAPLRLGNTSRTISLILAFGLIVPAVGVASQAYRYRTSRSETEFRRSRLLFWALIPALVMSLSILVVGVSDSAFTTFQGRGLPIIPTSLFRIFQPVFALIPLALFVGILRYRLWNIERVISRALMYGLLAGFVSAVYVGIVVVLGRAIGTTGDNVLLSIAATGMIAVAFAPVSQRVRLLAERLVYGRRATPYEVLSELSTVVTDDADTAEKLTRVAELLAAGTSSRRADVWLIVSGEIRHEAAWPPDAAPREAHPIQGDVLPDLGPVTAVTEVRHDGELLGALTTTKPGSEVMSPADTKLLTDLAGQAGLLLRNVRLTAQLLDRLAELQRSRQRIVTAQDEGRRRLERNLHDGAQQELVALKVRLGLAERLAAQGKPVGDFLHQLTADTDSALKTLRALAQGIYPPLLASEGLRPALTAHARRSTLPVTVVGEAPRYDQDVEAAVYFCCLEALQNAAKYAGDCTVTLTMGADVAGVNFVVADDGAGFDADDRVCGSGTQNMIDRVEALGGTLEVVSTPGAGTSVTGRIPALPRPREQSDTPVSASLGH